MKITLRYFASIRETLGLSTEVLECAPGTLQSLRDQLLARGGDYADALARGKAVRMALNQVMSEETAPLLDGCTQNRSNLLLPEDCVEGAWAVLAVEREILPLRRLWVCSFCHWP